MENETKQHLVYQCKWSSPLNIDPNLVFFLFKPDVIEFLENIGTSSAMTIRPLQVSTQSVEYLEATKWKGVYRNKHLQF